LDQMKIAFSPELGRSPFWERSSRALPDPELLPRRVRRVGPRIVPAVKLPRWPPLSHGGAFWNTSGRTKLPHCVPQGDFPLSTRDVGGPGQKWFRGLSASPSWVTRQGHVPPSFGLAQLSSLRASLWLSTCPSSSPRTEPRNPVSPQPRPGLAFCPARHRTSPFSLTCTTCLN
jgi:hypothetical protein